jgi:hypothetical protein
MDEKKQHVMNILKDMIANPPTREMELAAYLAEKATLILDYMPEPEVVTKKASKIDSFGTE